MPLEFEDLKTSKTNAEYVEGLLGDLSPAQTTTSADHSFIMKFYLAHNAMIDVNGFDGVLALGITDTS